MVLLYATIPSAALVGAFDVQTILKMPLDRLWRRVKNIAGVTKDEFVEYFHGLAEGVGIFVASTTRFEHPVPLTELRRVWKGFHPPQGFRYVTSHDLDLVNCQRFLAKDPRPARRAA
jgi:predicted transcriptional regulator